MLRVSNYTIFVDVPGGDVLLVHGYSGAWDLIAPEVASHLRALRRSEGFKPLTGNGFDTADSGAPHHTSLPERVCERLAKRGYVTELTADEEQARVSTIARELHGIAAHEPPSYVFALSYDCNLACPYCFQDALRSNPANASKLATMSTDMVDRIFAVMPEVEARHAPPGAPSASPPSRRITLFGGEPLLGRLHPLVEHTVSRAKSSGPSSIAAITNGTELQHFKDLISPDGISFLQITLDGSRDEHDRRRVGRARLPTFDRILDNVDLALSLGAQVKIRVNVDGSNLHSLPELAATMSARGWRESRLLSVYATPIHESAGSSHDACGFGSWHLSQTLVELAEAHASMRMIAGPDSPLKRRVREVLRGTADPLMSFQPAFCGAHTRIWVFDALGDIYACWERAGDVTARIGRLSANGTLVMNPPTLKMWRERTVASNPVCSRCPFAFYCGGGCALFAEMKNGTLHSNFCDDFARRFRTIALEELEALHFQRAVRSLAPSDDHDVVVGMEG